MTRNILSPRLAAGLTAGFALAVALPLSASAHVTINPDHAEPGDWTYVTFRVPTESDTAATTRLDVHLPADTFSSVTYQPAPGWSADVSGDTIAFTADGGGIAPGQFQTFTVALGPVPDVGSVVIPATQTYDDGTVVEWDATPEELADDDTLHPAPVLWIDDAPEDHDHDPASGNDGIAGSDASGTNATGPDAPGADAAASDVPGGLALGLSIAALLLGGGGVLLGAFALGRRRAAS